MKESYRFSDAEWEMIKRLIPACKKRRDGQMQSFERPEAGAGRHRLDFNQRLSLAPAAESEFPSYQTCHRYFQNWTKEGVSKKILRIQPLPCKRIEPKGDAFL